jgi:cyclophilin family peptidyl-prolyl cis-trans isomerase
MIKAVKFHFLLLYFTVPHIAFSDVNSAMQVMESDSNPLMLLSTSLGDIYIELFKVEAPNNVRNFLALAHGEIEFKEKNSGNTFYPRYFDGMQFHRVIPNMLIQAGSPQYHPLGIPSRILDDEINADVLGLDEQPVLNEFGEFNSLLNISDRSNFRDVLLEPILKHLRIGSDSELTDRQYEIYDFIVNLTIKQAYELEGYTYNSDLTTRPITRSIVALANSGPNSNGPEFFIATNDLPWLNGKYTVIGKVVEGMDTVDAISRTEIDPLDPSRFATLIYSFRAVN